MGTWSLVSLIAGNRLAVSLPANYFGRSAAKPFTHNAGSMTLYRRSGEERANNLPFLSTTAATLSAT